jgi:hypothetical protein
LVCFCAHRISAFCAVSAFAMWYFATILTPIVSVSGGCK